MRPQSIVAVILALVFGGTAAVGVRRYVGIGQPQAETVPVVVAKMNISRGMLISEDLIKTRDYPRELIPAGAVLKIEDAIERSAFASMVKDEPILDSKLSPKGHRGMAAQVAEGMRAFTITTNLASGVAGFILPGNKVDVLLTVQGGGAYDYTGGGVTTTLLQNVEILAVDQRVEAPAENKVSANDLRSVTLQVTPSQAAKLSLGQTKGTLHLTLRNPQDDSPAKVLPTTVHDIQFLGEAPSRPWDERAKDLIKAWGEALARRPPPPPPAPPTVKVEPPKQRVTIRTIRGNSEGQVILTPADS
ncbi:MAG TPA: Flp pilus assembly protein CpaB [Isosphaeraceae bacterium]|nr:Flp pilus assembly protein CpaB [Isosphaeraceae bacterium]